MSVCDDGEELQSWGWTDLSSYSSALLDSEKEQHVDWFMQTGIMSRRSLRLDHGLLDHTLPHNSASFSLGGNEWRSSRSLKPRRSQQLSLSCSESLLQTPRKQNVHLLHNSSLHSVASDASLISSLLDESSIQETTLVDTLWGLDQDVDPKESTVLSEQLTAIEDRTLIGPEGHCPIHAPHTLGRVYCKDCEKKCDKKESTFCSASAPQEPEDPETSIIYSRDRIRKGHIGMLASVWDRSASGVISLLALLHHHMMLHKHTDLTVRSSHWRVMSLRDGGANQEEGQPNGSLCKSAADVYSWLSRRWRHMNASLPLNRFLQLLLLLLPLLLLLGLCWFSPAGIHSFLPAVKLTEWSAVLPDAPVLSSIYSSSHSHSPPAEGALDQRTVEQTVQEPVHRRRPDDAEGGKSGLVAEEQSERLVRLERSLTALWEQVEAGGRRAEQRHKEVLHLYADLQRQTISGQNAGDEEKWLSELMETRLQPIRTRVEEERRSREQSRQEDLLQQQSESTRLDELERKLQSLAARTQEVQQKHQDSADAPSPSLPALSVGLDRQSHDALLADVARLEAVLEDVKRDVEGLWTCKDGCREIDQIQATLSAQVSSQVREEVRTLLYGNGLVLRGGDSADLPDSLLQWLSQRYVSGVDLQGALASLEHSILQNISLQLKQRHSADGLRESVIHVAGAAGAAVTEEDVNAIVANALRLFSHDRTGLADYALESGGGSILSTRCSQTYETKAALLSLFGFPLWYFSQSPRVVIQPDVHPGNCWAFKGSTGFLVIRLSMRIVPTAFSMEHIPKALAPSGTLRSAPKDFSVYGLDDEGQERGKLLGTYMYDDDGESLQTYPVSEENNEAFQIIEVQVLSNRGHKEYTCLYRFRVHGTPADI